MNPCQEYKERLILDVYGELDPYEQSALEEHFELCEGCRRERDRLILFVQQLRNAIPKPSLSPEHHMGAAPRGDLVSRSTECVDGLPP